MSRRPEGKTSCLPGFVAAYMQAYEEMRATGRKTPIKGFSGWHVSPPRHDDETT